MQTAWDGAVGLGDARERQEVAGDTRAATVAHDAPLRSLVGAERPRMSEAGTTVELASVDDHRDVRVVLVVLDELWIELVSDWLGHDAVDHLLIDLTLRPPIIKALGRS